MLNGTQLEISVRDTSGKVANFWAFDTEAVEAIKEAGTEAALETQAIAFELCPVDTGFMRDHIDVVMSEQGQTWEIGWRADDFYEAGLEFYPLFVVFGTRHMAPRDPLTPAYQQAKEIFQQKITAAIRAAVERKKMAAT